MVPTSIKRVSNPSYSIIYGIITRIIITLFKRNNPMACRKSYMDISLDYMALKTLSLLLCAVGVRI